jgi:hypothetical protein
MMTLYHECFLYSEAPVVSSYGSKSSSLSSEGFDFKHVRGHQLENLEIRAYVDVGHACKGPEGSPGVKSRSSRPNRFEIHRE